MKTPISRYGIFFLVLFIASDVWAAQGPNIQERRAAQEAQAMAMKKQQEIAIFKKQRDELLMAYKALVKVKNDTYGQMKISERDYKAAMAKFEQAKNQEAQIQSQMTELKHNRQKFEAATLESQATKLRDNQSQLLENMKIFSKIQQDSYAAMMTADNLYRSFLTKEQVLRQQIDNVQRQLQFVVTQP